MIKMAAVTEIVAQRDGGGKRSGNGFRFAGEALFLAADGEAGAHGGGFSVLRGGREGRDFALCCVLPPRHLPIALQRGGKGGGLKKAFLHICGYAIFLIGSLKTEFCCDFPASPARAACLCLVHCYFRLVQQSCSQDGLATCFCTQNFTKPIFQRPKGFSILNSVKFVKFVWGQGDGAAARGAPK